MHPLFSLLYGSTNDYVAEICDKQPVVIYDKASIYTIGEPDAPDLVKKEQEHLNCIQAQIIFEYLQNILLDGG